MSELVIPLDYEQLPEFWQLKSSLARAKPSPDIHPKQIEQAATFIFFRLFVTLGYLARSTNEPGQLSKEGAEQYVSSLDPLFGDDMKPMEIIEGSKLITPMEGGWFCPMFARLNAHLAGNYQRPCDKGNVNSRLSAAFKKIQAEAVQQCMLFPPDLFRDAEGKEMDDVASRRSMVLIRMLDRCLNLPERKAEAFTPGVMAAACDIVRRHENEALKNFYFWLANKGRNHPAIPKQSELIMQDFDKYFRLQNG